MEENNIDFDDYNCPKCGEPLIDHYHSCGICPKCGNIVTEEDLK